MNVRGSYRALLNNSKAAMMAAIEIYNKPQFQYRDECFSILLINSWELLLKAILSKHGERIFYPKERHEKYKTLSLKDALKRVRPYFPEQIGYEPVSANIKDLEAYRDSAIHFYNEDGFAALIYGLAQTSIVNYRDLVISVFNIDVAKDITISLLPLALGPYPDPIEFLQHSRDGKRRSKAVSEYLESISSTTRQLEAAHYDTGRYLTVFNISLNSVKKISGADVVAGLDTDKGGTNPVIITQTRDPNVSHPLRQKDICAEIGETLHGVRFTTYTITALVWKYGLRENLQYAWRSKLGGGTQYSRDIVPFIRRLTADDLQKALDDYRAHLKKRLS